MLKEIKEFLQANGNSSVADIVIGLRLDRAMVQSVIDEWVRQGKILKNKNDVACMGGCKGCSGACPSLVVSPLANDEYYYSWID